MKKWKTLRDRYVRERKKVKRKPSGEAGPCYKSCWCFYEALSFLGDTVKHRGCVACCRLTGGVNHIMIMSLASQ